MWKVWRCGSRGRCGGVRVAEVWKDERCGRCRRCGTCGGVGGGPTSTSSVDVQLRQGQGQGQLAALGVAGTLQNVVHSVPASRPAGGDEVCICGLGIRHRSCITHTAIPAKHSRTHTLTHTLRSAGSSQCFTNPQKIS